ncbi:HAD family hydrolase [Moorena sp. SIO3H5]|uniref:HAD family hydrolase n=1 Tax=Moorena sp. SIO3H5 TaxID=2607834 RepID=UPI0013B8509D|nr:HAD family hydrolase [Moorena sp. SIO3H5]NEO74620.1 HAD family hydrolase [Moorena sp. SIO3H5]
MLRIITDFDGPIIDVSERYYRVYQICLEKTRNREQTVRELTKAEFWELKRERVPETQIGIISGLDKAQAQTFSQMRRQTVHTQPYFQYDCLAWGAVNTMLKIKQMGIDLAVMTMRRVRELNYALNRYDLDNFFPENRRYCLSNNYIKTHDVEDKPLFLSNNYIKTHDVEDKPLLMARALNELPPAYDTWMIGDTEADIVAAKRHGIKVIAVECGIRDRAQLESQLPDLIVQDFSCAVKLVLENSLQQVG